MPIKQRLLNLLFWSVLSAAFIGPGTITTAASAGAGYGFTLIWALMFSTLACILLQEAAARITLQSGRDLGQVIRDRFRHSTAGRVLIGLVLSSILLGCAAYEAGNILGGIAGAALLLNLPLPLLTFVIAGSSALLLWFGSTRQVAQTLGVVVAVMGIVFLTTAIATEPDPLRLLEGSLTPAIPTGSELLVIGLIGTTVVPYNLFLGSGLKHTQSLREMRWSLGLALLLGGIISIGVLVVGGNITGSFTYERLARQLELTLGGWGASFFALGLFAAGVSSALTAPLAAAITARSLLSVNGNRQTSWSAKGWKYRITWGSVLLTGTVFGILQVQPVPAIILAQALNGIILPLIAAVLLLLINDRRLLTENLVNSLSLNLLTGLVVAVTILIGLTQVARALTAAFAVDLVSESHLLWGALLITVLISMPLVKKILSYRSG